MAMPDRMATITARMTACKYALSGVVAAGRMMQEASHREQDVVERAAERDRQELLRKWLETRP